MSADVRPLPVHPYPLTAAQESTLRQAKAELDLPYLVQVVPAVPGSPGRMLCFGEPAPFYTESVVIRPENVERLESVKAALDFMLNAPAGAAGSFTEEMWMQAMFGEGTKLAYEILPDRLDQLVGGDGFGGPGR
jgi:hypothetical protein